MNLSTYAADVGLSAIDASLANGTLVFYSGAMPATPQTAVVAGNTALVTFTFTATPFGASANTAGSPGYTQQTANFVSNSVAPAANGTATFARAFRSAANGSTVVADYTLGTSGTDIIIGNTGIQTGVNVSLTSFAHRLPSTS